MPGKRIILLLTGCLIGSGLSFFSSCYYDNKEALYGIVPCDTTSVSYADDIVPILENGCYTCHDHSSAEIVGQDNNLEGYDNLSGYVVAGDPENSLFYAAVAWLPGSVHMPYPIGSDQLGDCEIALIRSWISQGALNN